MSDLAVPTLSHLPKAQRYQAYVQTVGRPRLARAGRGHVSSSEVIRGIQQALDEPRTPLNGPPRIRAQRIVKTPEVSTPKRSVFASLWGAVTQCLRKPVS